MVSSKGDESARAPAETGSESTDQQSFMARHAGTLLPVGLMLALAALLLWGMLDSR